MATVVYASPIPTTCNLCDQPITDTFIDGKTADMGLWAIMCPKCHKIRGIGLGLGKGQRFNKTVINGKVVWVKEEVCQ